MTQAYIAGELGEAERAVRVLRSAEEAGTSIFADLHSTPHFRSIRDHPAFRAYQEPKG